MHNLTQVEGASGLRVGKALCSCFPRWMHRNGGNVQDLKDNQVWQYKFLLFSFGWSPGQVRTFCTHSLGCFHNHTHPSVVTLHIYYIYFTIHSVLCMHLYVSWLLIFKHLAIPVSRQANILKIYLLLSNFFNIFCYVYPKHGQHLTE